MNAEEMKDEPTESGFEKKVLFHGNHLSKINERQGFTKVASALAREISRAYAEIDRLEQLANQK